jgi:lipopolysaccharide/colanic/teichoic acid biosynthesis glycosyltransferase
MTRKRALDLTLTVLGAIAWVPVVLIGALLVLVTSGRPVFYRSHRRVSTGRLMRVVKFRTMVKNADKIANRETLPVTNVRFLNIPSDSPLYTRAGRLLERCGITELPQFVHVLTGRMSIVGNRPLPDNVLDCLREEYSYADDRFLTPAGLTGPAQLVGRDALTDDERLRLESAYCRACVHSYSMWLDLSILIYTVLIVAGVKKSLDYQGVLDFIDRRSKSPRLVEQSEPALADPETSGLVVE